jgi:hypothetical protein
MTSTRQKLSAKLTTKKHLKQIFFHKNRRTDPFIIGYFETIGKENFFTLIYT